MSERQDNPDQKLIEALAAIEHEQWVHWSRATAADVPVAMQQKWRRSWVKYAELPDDLKEADRIWARKVASLLREQKVI